MPVHTPVSRPVVRHPLTLATHPAQYLFRRYFKPNDTALRFYADTLRGLAERGIAAAGGLADADTARLDEQIAAIQAQYTSQQLAYNQQLERLADPINVQYTNPLVQEVTESNPRTRRLAALFRQLDALVQQIDTLWMADALTDQERMQQIRQGVRAPLRRLVVAIITLALRARALAAIYQQPGAAVTALESLAVTLRDEPGRWGEHAFYTANQVWLRWPLSEVATLTTWQVAGWLAGRPQPLDSETLLVGLNAQVSEWITVLAEVSRARRRTMQFDHPARLQALREPARTSAVVESSVVSVESVESPVSRVSDNVVESHAARP